MLHAWWHLFAGLSSSKDDEISAKRVQHLFDVLQPLLFPLQFFVLDRSLKHDTGRKTTEGEGFFHA